MPYFVPSTNIKLMNYQVIRMKDGKMGFEQPTGAGNNRPG